MSETEVIFREDGKSNRTFWLIAGSILPLALMALGVIKVWSLESSQGIVDTTTEHAVFFIGRFIGFPLGLLNIFVLTDALRKGTLQKAPAIAGIIIAILNILLGLLMWIAYFMVMAFAAAF
jgi:hypothetical protein